MRILCCYANLHPATAQAVEDFAPTAEFVDVSGNSLAYWQAIKSRWTGEQDLVIIEQDIAITADVIPTFERCNDNWCVYAFKGPAHIGYMKHSLGCTKFSARLQRAAPANEIASDLTWQFIDVTVARYLDRLNFDSNCHGVLGHYHDYDSECEQYRYSSFKWSCSVKPDRSYQLYRNNPDGTCTEIEAL